MLYTVTLNDENFILSIAHTKSDNVELDLSGVDMKHLSAYQLTPEGLVLDEEKLAEMIAEEEQEVIDEEITDLKQKLNATDYIMAETFEEIMSLDNSVTFIVDFIRIVKSFYQQYADVIAQRKAWRQRIKELEK